MSGWSSQAELIHAFEKNSGGEEVRISLTTYKGREYLDIRVYYQGDDGEKHPTKKGITLSLDLLSELEAGLSKLRKGVA